MHVKLKTKTRLQNIGVSVGVCKMFITNKYYTTSYDLKKKKPIEFKLGINKL